LTRFNTKKEGAKFWSLSEDSTPSNVAIFRVFNSPSCPSSSRKYLLHVSDRNGDVEVGWFLLSDCQTSKGDTGTGSWWLVHLTENKGDLGLAIKLDDTSLLHFVVQVVTLTSTLTDTSEDGETTVSLGDVVLFVC